MNYKSFPKKYFNISQGNNKNDDFTLESLDKNLSPYRLKYLKPFIMNLPKNAKLLDLGSGTGKACMIVKAYRPDVQLYATDISDLGEHFPKDIDFKQGSAEDLKSLYPENFFDGIISLHLIEHLIFPMDMIDGIRHVLKKGGRVFIETPNWTRVFVPFSYMFFYNDYTHIRPFSVFAMTKLFVEFNLKPITIKPARTNFWFGKTNRSLKKGKKFVSSAVTANESRGLLMRIVGKIANPMIWDVLIAIGEK